METTEQDASPPLLGRLLDGRYQLDALIARGGMATVYRATDTRLDRQVAVKVMHRALAEDPEFVRRFTREARAAARVQSPEVVLVHDTGTDPGTGLAYLVMEYIDGINLRQLLQQQGPQSPARAVALVVPVLRALAAAHTAGLVHRDVKPENVLLAADGRIKVTDFGLARAVETSNLTQTTGLLIGTVSYLAPEQVEHGSADARTDVYATGVLLWELLTGKVPYGGDSPFSVAYKHVNEDVPAPSTITAGIPVALDALVVRATRREPDLRPADASEFLTALLAVQRGLPEAATEQQTLVVSLPQKVPAKVPLKARRARKHRRGLIATAALLVLALLALGSGYYLGSYRYTKAPSVVGLTLKVAEDRLKHDGLSDRQGTGDFSETVAAGLVLRQDPQGGGKVRKHGTVTLVLSKGPERITVPPLAGRDVDAATRALTDLQLVVADQPVQEYSPTVGKGLVIRTDPSAGTKLRKDTPVRLIVSKGKEPLDVPNVTGKPQDEATKALAGFNVVVVQQFSDQVEKGRVISQTPDHGTADRGSTVTLTVSKGPDVVVVPDVTGMSENDARAELEGLGLSVKVSRFPHGPGRVVSQDPQGGTTVKRGASVHIYVY
jgi:beta-lactam-binding protein with PASTA domain/tRNA A-37 threonylcarbamoyl transferase component Bud32